MPIEDTVDYWKCRCEALDDALAERTQEVRDLSALLERIAYAILKGDPAYAESVGNRTVDYLNRLGLQGSIIRLMESQGKK